MHPTISISSGAQVLGACTELNQVSCQLSHQSPHSLAANAWKGDKCRRYHASRLSTLLACQAASGSRLSAVSLSPEVYAKLMRGGEQCLGDSEREGRNDSNSALNFKLLPLQLLTNFHRGFRQLALLGVKTLWTGDGGTAAIGALSEVSSFRQAWSAIPLQSKIVMRYFGALVSGRYLPASWWQDFSSIALQQA